MYGLTWKIPDFDVCFASMNGSRLWFSMVWFGQSQILNGPSVDGSQRKLEQRCGVFLIKGGEGGILKDIVLTLNYEKLAFQKSAIPKILIYRLGIIRRPIGYVRGCSINTVVMN